MIWTVFCQQLFTFFFVRDIFCVSVTFKGGFRDIFYFDLTPLMPVDLENIESRFGFAVCVLRFFFKFSAHETRRLLNAQTKEKLNRRRYN